MSPRNNRTGPFRRAALLACPSVSARPKRPSHVRTSGRGFTLLEVLLALAIIGFALAMVGELVRLGARCAAESEQLSRAHLLAESLLSEITAGVTTPASVNQVSSPTDPDFLYSVTIDRPDQQGLIAVTVVVESLEFDPNRRLTYRLTGWIVDPGLELPEDSSSSDSNSTSSSSSSSSSSTSGGGNG